MIYSKHHDAGSLRIECRSEHIPIHLQWISGYSVKRHVHSVSSLDVHREFEYQLIVKGRGTYLINNRQYHFKARSVLIIPPGVSHCWRPEPNCLIEKICLLFRKGMKSQLGAIGLFDAPCYFEFSEAEMTEAVFILRQIAQEYREQADWWVKAVQAGLMKLLILIKRASLRPAKRAQNDRLTAGMLDYLESRFKQKLYMRELSAHFGFSADYLSKYFKRRVGMGIKHYLLQRRIIEAKKILEDHPELTIRAVAEAVGFNDFTVFNRSFKICLGMTSAVYRGIYHRQA